MSLCSLLSYSYGGVISLCFISNDAQKTGARQADLELVVLGFPYVLLLVRPYKRTGPRVDRFVNQLDAEGTKGHSQSERRPTNMLAMQKHTQRYHPLPNLHHRGSRLVPVNLCDASPGALLARV